MLVTALNVLLLLLLLLRTAIYCAYTLLKIGCAAKTTPRTALLLLACSGTTHCLLQQLVCSRAVFDDALFVIAGLQRKNTCFFWSAA